jgi:hypothetical protein
MNRADSPLRRAYEQYVEERGLYSPLLKHLREKELAQATLQAKDAIKN